ncbi:unnamed protein product [Microthlaspi erraticum]|uniref:Uncharacterized protein n=1 Tax=Microthlaspi erraticum TaxID=1685480 RepID=A0A6D2JGH6_9BRAS|nr:unnamed protein product [Microthlaspi erraticum]
MVKQKAESLEEAPIVERLVVCPTVEHLVVFPIVAHLVVCPIVELVGVIPIVEDLVVCSLVENLEPIILLSFVLLNCYRQKMEFQMISLLSVDSHTIGFALIVSAHLSCFVKHQSLLPTFVACPRLYFQLYR